MIEIREIRTIRELKQFVLFPFGLYRNHPCYVPPLIADELHTLRRDRNPAFAHCEARYWMAFEQGRPVGRIAGIINRIFVEQRHQRYARFGWVDFIDNEAVSRALLETVETWARSAGMTAVHGPLGFSELDYLGMLVEGFDELGTMAGIYNYPYYPRHLERLAYVKDADWVEFEIKVPPQLPERAQRIAAYVRKKSKFRVLDVRRAKDLVPYAHELFALLNEAYRDLYGFVPLTVAQIDDCVRRYFSIVVPDFITVVLDADNRVAGFIIAMPSFSRALQKAQGRLFPFGFLHLWRALRRPKNLDFYLAAVRPELQGSGVEALLTQSSYEACARHGIVSAESNWELETNAKVQAAWKLFDHRQHKRRRCFIKHWS